MLEIVSNEPEASNATCNPVSPTWSLPPLSPPIISPYLSSPHDELEASVNNKADFSSGTCKIINTNCIYRYIYVCPYLVDTLELELVVSELENTVDKIKQTQADMGSKMEHMGSKMEDMGYKLDDFCDRMKKLEQYTFTPYPYPPPPMPFAFSPLPARQPVNSPPVETPHSASSSSTATRSDADYSAPPTTPPTDTKPTKTLKCIPITASQHCLPVEEIDRDNLVPPHVTIDKYPKLQVESKVSQLAIKLAKESFFGDSVLLQCTVAGQGKLSALPNAPLNDLKRAIFKLLPKYHQHPMSFEKTWKDCSEAIGQCCKRLRLDHQKRKAIVLD